MKKEVKVRFHCNEFLIIIDPQQLLSAIEEIVHRGWGIKNQSIPLIKSYLWCECENKPMFILCCINGPLWYLIPFNGKGYIHIMRNIYMSSKKEEQKTTTVTSSSTTASTSPSQQLQEQNHLVSRSLDETKDSIRRSIHESRSQIPRYTHAVSDYQEQTIQAAREIADNFVESQKQIINLFQSVLTPYAENVNEITTNWATLFSPRKVSEVYANIVSNLANNVITVTRVTNNMIFGNMDAFKTSLQQAKDSAKDFPRIGVNTAKTFEQTSRDNNARQTSSVNIL